MTDLRQIVHSCTLIRHSRGSATILPPVTVSAFMRPILRPLAAALVGLAIVTCTDAPSGPHAGARAASITFAPMFSRSAAQTAALLERFGISYDHVRTVVLRPPSDTVRDTTIAFASGDTAIDLELSVRVQEDGELFHVSIDYAGQTGIVFHGEGDVRAHDAHDEAPATPAIVLNYAGPGATAAKIAIQPKAVSLLATDSSRTFTVTAADSSGAVVAPPPVSWTTSDGTLATIDSHGTLQPLGHRGNVTVTGTTITALTDNAAATLTLPAAAIALVSGSGQSGTAHASLPSPAVVQVRAADSTGVAGVTVVFAAPTGGSVNPTSVVTDANGMASSTLTLGTTAGPQSFVATALGFGVAIPAIASAAAPAAMVFVDPATLAPLTSAPGLVTLVGGALPSTTPAVKLTDASGNVVPNATVDVDMRSPSQSLVTAQLITNANGVARFSSLTIPSIVLQTAGTLSFVVSNSSLPTSSTLTLSVQAVGTVATLRPVAGVVSTTVGSLLNDSLYPSFVALDANGVPVPGVSVALSLAGICSLAAGGDTATVKTDTLGHASLTASTLAVPVGAPGSCSINAGARSPAGDIPGTLASIVVAPTGVPTWIGVSADWVTGSNWNTGAAPTFSQAVFIPAFAPAHPMLQAAASVGDLTIEPSGSLDLNGNTLTVNGNLTAAGGSIADNLRGGTLVLSKGSPGTIDAVVSAAVSIGSSTCNGTSYTVTGIFTVNGSLTVNCPLDLGSAQLAVMRDLAVQNSGTLQLTQSNAVAVVQGNATFAGASESGLLSKGLLELGGNLTQLATVSSASFSADSGFLVQMTGKAAQSISFASPGTAPSNSRFADLLVQPGASITFASHASIVGTLAQNGTMTASTNDTLTLAGQAQFNAGSVTTIAAGSAVTLVASGLFAGGSLLTLDGVMTVDPPASVTFNASAQITGSGSFLLVQGASCGVSTSAIVSGLFSTMLPQLCASIP